MNPFKDLCAFGSLQVELTSFRIPEMTRAYLTKESNADLNAVFMLRIKIGSESTCIFLQAPSQVIDPHHHKFTANIESVSDKIYVEFYDVLDESAFDPSTASSTDVSNLKLLTIKCFDVKDFAFNQDDFCEGHRVLLPVEFSGNVASFTFNARFHQEVPM